MAKKPHNDSFWTGYIGLFEVCRRYLSAYGGIGALTRSPYLHIAILVTAISFEFWSKPGWWSQPIAVIPSLLGFSLGGYAIWLAWGDERFRSIVAGRKIVMKESGDFVPDNEESPYEGVSATFAHYILIQVTALVFALVALALNFFPGDQHWAVKLFGRELLQNGAVVAGGLGYLLFVYALLNTLAAGMGLFRISGWYDDHHTSMRLREAKKKALSTEDEC